jgi:integrase
MRGCLKKRSEDSWSIILTLGRKVDPVTGKSKPDQKWITVKGTKKEAEAKLAELLHQYNTGEFVSPNKITTGEWLTRWLDVYIMKSSQKKLRTKETYKTVVENHLIPNLGSIPIQKLIPIHLQNYYNSSKLSSGTLSQHHAIIHQALKVAMQQERLITHNPAELVAEKPNGKESTEIITWDEEEIKKFLAVARKKSMQAFVFYSLAIETGLRKGEICGLMWQDINLKECRISVCRTLLKSGKNPTLGSPKNGKSRAITISPQMADLLRRHKVEQNQLKLKMGELFSDLGYVFTKKNGGPLQINNLSENEFDKLIKRAGVKDIRFHDLRHTAATLMLGQGIHPKVVQERLGHSDIAITMNRYSHVTPTMQKEAATAIANLIHK